MQTVRLATTLLASALLSLPLSAADADRPFQGTWQLVADQSSSSSPLPESLVCKIRQSPERIQIDSTWKGMKGGMYGLALVGVTSDKIELPLDGSEATHFDGPYAIKSKTRVEGNRILTEYSAAIQDNEPLQGQWTRILSEDGREMVLEIKSTTPNHGDAAEARLVFRRK